MTKLTLLYDESEIQFDLPFSDVKILLPKAQKPFQDPEKTIRDAFKSPVLASNTEEAERNYVNYAGKMIAIAINDQTRPLPHAILLPLLIEYLVNNQADPQRIVFYIATGTHRQLTAEEINRVLPNGLAANYKHVCHNCDNQDELLYLGVTARQTPVYVNQFFHQSDVKIVVGNIELHHFMGFSGGYKTASIGLTGRQTIEKNHAMLTDPQAKMGLFLDNPMRVDVEEIGHMIGVDYALNVVMNDEKEILHAYWGNPHWVMQKGTADALTGCQLDQPVSDCHYDLVIASAGGYPKDINLYQAQKALTNACLFSRENGVIILAAGCRDGAGNQKFVDYMCNQASWEDVLEDFPRHPFEIGPHKAYQLALQAKDHHIFLISKIPAEEAKNYLVTPARDFKEAFSLAAPFLPAQSRVVVLPFATHSMPNMGGGGG